MSELLNGMPALVAGINPDLALFAAFLLLLGLVPVLVAVAGADWPAEGAGASILPAAGRLNLGQYPARGRGCSAAPRQTRLRRCPPPPRPFA